MAENPYLNKLFPHGLTDFPIVNGAVLLPSKQALANMFRGEQRYVGVDVGRGVYPVAEGLQMLVGYPKPVHVRLYATGDMTHQALSAHHHMVLYNGVDNRRPNERAGITIDRICPGAPFDLDCGCRLRTQEALTNLQNPNPESWVYIAIDLGTSTGHIPSIVSAIGEDLHVERSDRVTTTDHLLSSCATVNSLRRSELDTCQFIETVGGRDYFVTADIPVLFRRGHKARLIQIEEPSRLDTNGMAGKGMKHYVFIYGNIYDLNNPPVVRYHSSCITAELHGNGCDCRMQLEDTIGYCVDHGSGIIIFAGEEGMGTGLINKLWQTQLTGSGETDLLTAREHYLDLPQDLRNYGLIQIVRKLLGIQQILLASNNLKKARAFEANGMSIIGSYPMVVDKTKLSLHALRDVEAKEGSGRYLKYS